MDIERLPKHARCWIPDCGGAVVMRLFQKDYGEIIGFCPRHRPVLHFTHGSDIEVQAESREEDRP